MRTLTIRINNPITGENLVDETVELDDDQDPSELFMEVLENNLDIEVLENGKNIKGVLH